MTALALGQAPPSLAIRSLGGFGVLRDGEPVPLCAWQSRKARDLLKLLVARRGRPVPRECLLEALWPEEDPRRSSCRLSVALSTLRSVLDPEHRFAPDHYVVGARDAISLRMSAVELDLGAFVARAEEGLALVRAGRGQAGLASLEAAERAYGGDFLEEDLFEDWAAGPREEARAVYLTVARALVELAAGRGDHDGACRYSLRILERDPYDERANLALVSARVSARAHGEARRAYRRYADRMAEIGVEPAPYPHPRPTLAATGKPAPAAAVGYA